MKSLILMNPTRRRRRASRKLYGAALKAHQRKAGRRNPTRRRRSSRRRVIRRNPPTVARRTRHHSPAMRAKISRAVKAANRRRSSRPMATRVRSLARRVRSSGGGLVRHFRRRRSGGGSGGSLSIRSLMSPTLLKTASGAIGASFITSWLLRTYGSRLPMAGTTYGRIAYKLAIPFAGAYAAKKFLKQHDVANGMLIGGVVMAINDLIAGFNAPKTAAGAVAGASGYAGPADFASRMIDGMTVENALAGGDEFDEDPDGMGEYFDAPVDPLYSNTPAFTSAFA